MRRLSIGWVVVLLLAGTAVGCGGGGGDDPAGCSGDGDCNGLTCCGGACVDLATSERHCGACGTACGAGGTCCAGGCVDTDTSAANCGSCGSACPAVANGTPGCAAAACGLASCDAGFASCDGQAGNGCEVDTTSDVVNCGGCGAGCPAPANGTAGCSSSTCGVASCNAGFGDCDSQAANGCEVNTTSDVANCGGCGLACPNPANGTAGCASSVCGVASCNGTFRNCDNIAANGCEVNSASDANNCGACNTMCPTVPNGTRACISSVCAIGSCSAPFASCDGNVANGCETNTFTSVTNCGACGRFCAAVANGTPGCSAGVCGVGSCNAGFANCDNNAANGCEVNTATSATNCGGCGIVCAAGAACSAGTCKDKVLVVGAPSTPTWNDDVRAKLVATGAFGAVDTFNANTSTPTLAQLQQYKAVLVYSDTIFASAATLGDNLASYFDGGGRVVVAPFANATYPPGGRWASGGYALIASGSQAQPAEAAGLQLLDPASPLLAGVTSLTATAAFRSPGALINGAVRVANWGSGTPLVVLGQKGGRARVELNFYPPSSTVRADFWSGSGATIMKNALAFTGYCHSIVGTGGATCPSGKTFFCHTSPLSATSATQAKAACDTCYNLSCFLENADCAGAAYGPRPEGQYVLGEAYFGYAAGCSAGTAGRIWPIGSSTTTLGRWAP